MITKDQWRRFIDHPVVEWTIFVLGVLLIIIGIITGPIPGPGGIFFVAPGLAMVLKTSLWAKRRYVHFKRWEPNVPYLRFRRWRPTIGKRRVTPGQWTDWALRRRSARRATWNTRSAALEARASGRRTAAIGGRTSR